jgi:hypothetical protein
LTFDFRVHGQEQLPELNWIKNHWLFVCITALRSRRWRQYISPKHWKLVSNYTDSHPVTGTALGEPITSWISERLLLSTSSLHQNVSEVCRLSAISRSINH